MIGDTGQQQFVPVAQAGGISTTGLDQKGAHVKATTMGPARGPASASVSTSTGTGTGTTNASVSLSSASTHKFAQPPQQKHHLQFATTSIGMGRKKGGASARERKMSDQQKSERR